MNDAVRHGRALLRMFDVGAEAEFIYDAPSLFDETTDTPSEPVVIVISGHAVELDGDPSAYRDLSLTLAEPVTLLFIPNKIGECPKEDYTIVWDGKRRTVKQWKPIRPSGRILGATVILA